MAGLWVGNVDTSATDDEIREFLVRYGFPEYDAIEHIAGDGSRPAVLITFNDAPPQALRNLGDRIQDMFWKNRKIHVQVMDQR
jgi:RNA recognition motif-containing protein